MKLSLRDLAEILLLRGLVFSHEAIRDWEARLAPLLAEGLRKRRAKERALFEKPVNGAPRESAKARLQRELAALGLYNLKIDGIWGNGSQGALDKFRAHASAIDTILSEMEQ